MKRMVEKVKVVGVLVGFILTFAVVGFAQQPPTALDGQVSAAEALGRYEKLLQATTEPKQKFYLITKVAPTALAAGQTEKAKAYSLDLLQQAPALRNDWNYGNAIHVGNLVLGMIALTATDIPEAKRLLLEAGKTSGSPQLNSFGPNMLLAKQLLARGEREIVVQYFDLCSKFWELERGRLDQWKAVVNKGETPEFGANLGYQLSTWRVERWAKLQY